MERLTSFRALFLARLCGIDDDERERKQRAQPMPLCPDVRYWLEADMACSPVNVCSWG